MCLLHCYQGTCYSITLVFGISLESQPANGGFLTFCMIPFHYCFQFLMFWNSCIYLFFFLFQGWILVLDQPWKVPVVLTNIIVSHLWRGSRYWSITHQLHQCSTFCCDSNLQSTCRYFLPSWKTRWSSCWWPDPVQWTLIIRIFTVRIP